MAHSNQLSRRRRRGAPACWAPVRASIPVSLRGAWLAPCGLWCWWLVWAGRDPHGRAGEGPGTGRRPPGERKLLVALEGWWSAQPSAGAGRREAAEAGSPAAQTV